MRRLESDSVDPESLRAYPRHLWLSGLELELRVMEAGDGKQLLAFIRSLPEHDLLFLRRDVTQHEGIEAWLHDIERGAVTSVLALTAGEVLGYGTVHRSELRWSSHVAELRVMVAEHIRGKGLGRLLTQEAFAIALLQGIEKMTAQMTLDQKGAIAVFQGLGFQPEALLRDHVKDRNGKSHDLLILAHDVAGFEARLHALGLQDSFGF